MIWDSGSLHTRQFARNQIALAARLEIHQDHDEQLRFSFPDQHANVSVVDVSEGGMGLQTSTLLPRNVRMLIHVQLTAATSSLPGRETVVRGVVRRCQMVDVKPTYHIGVQYLDSDESVVRDLMKAYAPAGEGPAELSSAPTDGGPSRAG